MSLALAGVLLGESVVLHECVAEAGPKVGTNEKEPPIDWFLVHHIEQHGDYRLAETMGKSAGILGATSTGLIPPICVEQVSVYLG